MSKDDRRGGLRHRHWIPTAVLALGMAGAVGAAGAPATLGATALASATTPSPSLLTRFESAARAHHVDPAALLAKTLVLNVPNSSGGTTPTSLTVAQAIADVTPHHGSALQSAGSGLPGLPDINVGDVVHAYFNYGSGSALAYHVNQVPMVPSTPPLIVPLPLVGPVPEVGTLPVLYDAGGPLVNVTGSGYKVGYHTAGNFGVGANVDTAPGAPSPYPVWLPVKTGGTVISDTSINFTGHAIVFQTQVCLFGYCAGFGALVGDGATIFSQPPLPVSIPPTVPGAPALPTLPSAPGLPGLPTLPSAPGLPALPTLPGLPSAPVALP
ncbi:MAG: hypothetical protein ACYCV7_16090 [Acidimicrobiales bacterium]